jgi:Xaa-Pro aminopeptidase
MNISTRLQRKMKMKNQIFKKRIRQVRQILAEKNFDAAVLTVPSNINYLSGFTGDDSWLVVTGRGLYLITDGRYTLQAKKQCRNCKIYERKTPIVQATASVLNKLPKIKTICVEDKIEVRFFNNLRKKLNHPLKPVGKLVESIRQIKEQTEIAAIGKAAKIAQTALAKTLRRIRLGITERQLADILEFEMKKFGAAPSFETIVAFGSNSAMPHYRPANRRLKKVDTILFDFGAKLNGYCSDLTRCFAVGRASELYKKVYRTVFAAQAAAIKAVKSGRPAKVVDAAAKKIIKSAGLPVFGHGTGHGLGLDVHELPTVFAFSKELLQAGNVITLEPAVYLPNKFGIRIEDDVLITEKGCRALSSPLKNDDVPLLKVK